MKKANLITGAQTHGTGHRTDVRPDGRSGFQRKRPFRSRKSAKKPACTRPPPIASSMIWQRGVSSTAPSLAPTGWACVCWSWATWSRRRLNVRDAAITPMREFHKQIQQPVNLSMRQGDEIVYSNAPNSERSGMQVVRAIGGRAPLHLTSVGKLFWRWTIPSAFAPMPRERASAATPRTASPSFPRRSGSCPGAPDGSARTMKNWNWVCNAWRPASTMTRELIPAGLSISAPNGRAMKPGCPSCRT